MKQSSYPAPRDWHQDGKLAPLVIAVLARSLSLEGLREAIEYLQAVEAASNIEENEQNAEA